MKQSNLPIRYQPREGDRVINGARHPNVGGEGTAQASDYRGPIVKWDSGYTSYFGLNHHLRVL